MDVHIGVINSEIQDLQRYQDPCLKIKDLNDFIYLFIYLIFIYSLQSMVKKNKG